MIRRFCKKIIGIALVVAMMAGNVPTDVYAAKSVASDDIVKEASNEVIPTENNTDFDEADITDEEANEEKIKDEKSDNTEPVDAIVEDPYAEGKKRLEELKEGRDARKYGYVPDASDYTSYSVYDNLTDSEEISAKRYYESLPSKFDIRNEIELPAVRNQSPYGSCWAHSAMALAEINLIKKGLADKNINLSEMQTAVFAYTDVKDPLQGTYADSLTYKGSKSYVAIGGNLNYAKRYLAGWKGAVAEETVPYGLGQEFQKEISDTTKLAYEYDNVHIQGFKNADIVGERDAVKKLIMEYGAVSASYYDSNDYYNSTYNSYYNTKSLTTNHAITVIGWDDNFPKENFNTHAPEDGAWLIRNSWGDNTASHYGYFWLSYADVSLAEQAVAFDAEYVNYDNNYQYDGGYGGSSLNFGISAIYGANIFTAHANDIDPKVSSEILKAVSFETGKSNLNYEIQIYTDIKDSANPASGKLADEISGKTDYVGYYTVPLTKEIHISEGSDYSVVLKLSSSDGSAVPIMTDSNYAILGVVDTKASANTGESFYSTSNISNFRDASRYNNIKIKAFTDNVYSTTRYKINYVINGGGCFGINSNENPLYYYSTDEDIVLDYPQERYSDVYFAGWFTDKECTKAITKISKGSAGDITLYGKWMMDPYITGDCEATIDQNGVMTVSGEGETGDYTDGTQPWADKADIIKEIIFEEGVTRIGNNFANGFRNVEKIVIPKTVTEFGTYAFINCEKLNTIEYNAVNASGTNIVYYGYANSAKKYNRTLIIGEDVEKIGYYMFGGAQLCNIIWPDTCKVKIIDGYAFNGKQCFEEIDIPKSVTTINYNAFNKNDELTSINFYGTPTIGSNAFYATEIIDTDININGSDAFARSYDWAGSNRTTRYNTLQYKISYNLDGGTNNADNPNCYNGLSAITLKNPSKAGYSFDGFYESADFSGAKVTVIAAGTNRNITLYAKWVKCDHSKSSTTPTCSKSAICSVCGEEIAPTGIHTLSEWKQTKAPTCVSEGEKERHCTNTDCTYSETDKVAATGIHTLSAWKQTKAPTCVSEGEKERHCTNTDCTYSETDKVAATGIHTLSAWKQTKAPTCVSEGEKERHCTNAGCTYSETDKVAATGIHTLSAWKQTKAPTCTEAGEKERHCTNAGCTYNITEIIDPVSEGFQVILDSEEVDYNPKGAQPKFTVYFNGDILKPSVDYKVVYKNNKKAASKDSLLPPTVAITGAGRFTKSYTAKYTINQVDLNNLSYTETITTTKKTALKIPIYNDAVLLKNTDYDVFRLDGEKEIKMKPNDKLQDSCTLLVRAKANGNYKGEIKIEANVVEVLGNKIAVNADTSKIYYDGTELFPEIKVYDSKNKSTELEENTDYVVHCPVDMISAGAKTYIVEGIGNYSGTVTKKYTISPVILDSEDLDITYDDADLVFDANGTTLNELSVSATADGNSIDLTEGVDYTVKYASNKKITTTASKAKCTISFIGNYKGTKSQIISYDILPQSLENASVIVTDLVKCAPKGGVFKAKPIVDVNGVQIKNSNYNIRYYIGEDRQEMTSQNPVVFDDDGVETIYVEIEGKGNYVDIVNETVSYKVYSKNFSGDDMVDLSKAVINIDSTSYDPEYDGYEKKPEISVTVNSIGVESEDYKCYYSNNVLKGTATIVINGDGINTFGTKSKTFTIKAKSINR